MLNHTHRGLMPALVATALLGCTQPVAPGTSVKSQTIDQSGGTITVSASENQTLAGTSLSVPPGALARPVTITIALSSSPVAPAGTQAAGPVVDFEPSGTTFALPATVRLPVTVTAGATTAQLAIEAVEPDGTATRIPVQNVSNGLADFQVAGFTRYGGFTSNSDGGASCSTDAACADAGCQRDTDCATGTGCVNGSCEALDAGIVCQPPAEATTTTDAGYGCAPGAPVGDTSLGACTSQEFTLYCKADRDAGFFPGPAEGLDCAVLPIPTPVDVAVFCCPLVCGADAGSDGGTVDAGASSTDAGQADAGGVACGDTTCGAGEQCCNPSCGLCEPLGGACPAIACDGDAGGPGAACGDAGNCSGGELCFSVTACGGAAGRPCTVSWSCQSPTCNPATCACLQAAGSSDPCASSQMCAVDGGVVACQFDYP